MARSDVREQVLNGLGALLRPIIRVLIRAGVTWPDVSELGKAKFVEIATGDFGIRGRPTNAARVAILTGLDRREVARLRSDRQQSRVLAGGLMSKPTRVLEGWHRDPDFCDAKNGPRQLEVAGSEHSFTELVRRYAPGLPVVAMIKALLGAGAIEEVNDGRLRAAKRSYIPADLSEDQVRLWSSELEALATAVEHNLRTGERHRPRFHRRAISLRINPASLPAFQGFLEAEGQAFLERFDEWLLAHQQRDGDVIRLGVSVFHVQDGTRPAQVRRSS